jgi:ribonuclease VapC
VAGLICASRRIFAYALAKETGEPILFKGDDFARTDLLRA